MDFQPIISCSLLPQLERWEGGREERREEEREEGREEKDRNREELETRHTRCFPSFKH